MQIFEAVPDLNSFLYAGVRMNFQKRPILCTALYKTIKPIRGNFGGTFGQLFLQIFLESSLTV